MYQVELDVRNIRNLQLATFSIKLNRFDEAHVADNIEVHQAILKELLSGDVVPMGDFASWDLTYSRHNKLFFSQSWKFYVHYILDVECYHPKEQVLCFDLTITGYKSLDPVLGNEQDLTDYTYLTVDE